MSAPTTTRFLRRLCQTAPKRAPRVQAAPCSRSHALAARPASYPTSHGQRYLSTTTRRHAGLMPDTHEPQPPKGEDVEHVVTQPTEISDDEYHVRSDDYMEAVHEKAEMIQEERDDVDVEYSAGVLSISIPPAGTYIINKQPPNKQIWLSSPTSGPKRFDWVIKGEAMHQKEGGGHGDWIYLRDGTSLTELLMSEVGIAVDLHGHEESMQKSVDPIE